MWPYLDVGSLRGNQIKMRTLIQHDCVLMKKGNLDTETGTNTEKMMLRRSGKRQPCDWDDASTSQGTLETAGKHQKLGEPMKGLFLESSQRACQSFDLRLLGSRSVRQYISVVFSHLVCSTLYSSLWKWIQQMPYMHVKPSLPQVLLPLLVLLSLPFSCPSSPSLSIRAQFYQFLK